MKLELRRPLSEGDHAPVLLAVFSTPRARFDELQKASAFVRAYHQIERVQRKLKRGDLLAFAAILMVTIAASVGLGILLARSVTRRIGALVAATQAVAGGDLKVRVPELGNDELSELSRNFNRMLFELEINRARIDFLQRMSSWQEMARRLAHEIKNPLTPIVLSVQECHRKYPGGDPAFRKLLDTTLEVVEDEVGTLRRLVGEFSAFARLPKAELVEGDLREFLREEREHLLRLLEAGPESVGTGALEGRGPWAERVRATFRIPETPMPVAIDRQMMHRVFTNVFQNALQAIDSHSGRGVVEVRTEASADGYVVHFDDDGPGVPEAIRATVFDPYITTKADGTGLGLAIVKKIVVEHGGTIDVGKSPMGGASFRIRIPRLTQTAARVLNVSFVAGLLRGGERKSETAG